MLGERNVSVPEGAVSARTSPRRASTKRDISILIDGSFQAVAQAELCVFFARRSTMAAQRIRVSVGQAEQLAEDRATSRALARLRKQIREWDRAGIRRVRIRVQPRPAVPPPNELSVIISQPSKALRPLPRYRGPIVDKQGRRGIYLEISYDAARTNKLGVAKRRIAYMHKADHVEFYDECPLVVSNMGQSQREIEACADTLEAANRSARVNAIVGFVSIIQCPPEFDAAARADFLHAIAALFEEHGLPFCIAAHRPDLDGDQRNFHFHLWHSHRPCEHVGAYEWDIGEQLRGDMNGPEAMRRLRYDIAKLMTEVAHAHGHDLRFTHLSNAARGLHHRPMRKLGPAKTKLARDGKYVADAVANAAIIAENEALETLLQQRERAARITEKQAEFRPAAPVAVEPPRSTKVTTLSEPTPPDRIAEQSLIPLSVSPPHVEMPSKQPPTIAQMNGVSAADLKIFAPALAIAAPPAKSIVAVSYSKSAPKPTPAAISIAVPQATQAVLQPDQSWQSVNAPVALAAYKIVQLDTRISPMSLCSMLPRFYSHTMPLCHLSVTDIPKISALVRVTVQPRKVVSTVPLPSKEATPPPQVPTLVGVPINVAFPVMTGRRTPEIAEPQRGVLAELIALDERLKAFARGGSSNGRSLHPVPGQVTASGNHNASSAGGAGPPPPASTPVQPRSTMQGSADLAWARGLVKSHKAVAVLGEGRLRVIPYARGIERTLIVDAAQTAEAQTIADSSRPLIRSVERACETGRIAIDAAKKLSGDGTLSTDFIAFVRRLLDDDAFKLKLIAALDRFKAERESATAKREKEDRDGARRARIEGSTPFSSPPSPQPLRNEQTKVRDLSASSKRALERDVSNDLGLSRTGD